MVRLLPKSLFGRLTLALNVVLVAVLAVFTVWDLSATVSDRVAAKRNSLYDQAEAVAYAVRHLGPGEPAAVQRYIDSVCWQMRERFAPGHYILVRIGQDEVESAVHVRGPMTEADREAVRLAAETRQSGLMHGQRIVAASASLGSVTVYVAEYEADVRRAMRSSLVRRLLGLAAVALALGGVLTVAIDRLVRRPIRRLTEAIQGVGRGSLGVTIATPSVAELRRLGEEFNRMSAALARDEQDRQGRLERARRIQERLLPQHRQAQGYRISACHLPADTVAGDYWDLLDCPADRLVLCVADVSGHGVPAAMEAAMLKVLVTDAAACDLDPALMLARVNRRYEDLTVEDDFATLLLVRLSPREGTLVYASAGHEEAVLLHPMTTSGRSLAGRSEVEILDSTGPPIGIALDARWTSRSLPFGPGDRLVAVTDGVAEAQNPLGQPLGRRRLLSLVRDGRDRPLEELVAFLRGTVLAHLAGHLAADDMTIVAVERCAEGDGGTPAPRA